MLGWLIGGIAYDIFKSTVLEPTADWFVSAPTTVTTTTDINGNIYAP